MGVPSNTWLVGKVVYDPEDSDDMRSYRSHLPKWSSFFRQYKRKLPSLYRMELNLTETDILENLEATPPSVRSGSGKIPGFACAKCPGLQHVRATPAPEVDVCSTCACESHRVHAQAMITLVLHANPKSKSLGLPRARAQNLEYACPNQDHARATHAPEVNVPRKHAQSLDSIL